MASSLPASAVRYWSRLLASRYFDSAQDARNEVCRICERHSRDSWFTPEGKQTLPENRAFANAMPLYQEGDQWKVGQPLQEFDTMSSDFSDGTNGEPSGYPPSRGDADTAVGLPDYKYIERKKARHDKLLALRQRRDPNSLSKSPWDIKARTLEAKQSYRVKPGKVYWFEYRCWESDQSADADLWYHSHQEVKVLKMEEPGHGQDEDDRALNSCPAAFKIKFLSDGFTHTGMEDELLESQEEYINQDPPLPPHLR